MMINSINVINPIYMNELPQLIDILDDIVCVEKYTLDDDECMIEAFETCLSLIQDYIDDNQNAISSPDFQETLAEDVFEIVEIHLEETIHCYQYEEEQLYDIVMDAIEYYFEYISPPRTTITVDSFVQPQLILKDMVSEVSKQCITSIELSKECVKECVKEPFNIIFTDTSQTKEEKKARITEQIAYLDSLPQPAQRTPEWYEYRHNLITASNAYKAFDSQASKNQLIYEKCKPINMMSGHVNIASPMHWGQKYEPISVMIYEKKYNTIVKDFGCIQHDKYKFLGASPDGINADPESPIYGRMLEIKNPTTRVITGEPKKEYWVQCQLQMETCDLDECDFLETKFAEYENEELFEEDGTYFSSEKEEMKGIMLYFVDSEGTPRYIYKPLEMGKEEFKLWESETIEKYEAENNYTWIKNNYWKLSQISCVLVKRNVQWFRSNIQGLEEIWNIVLKERVTGYEHRAPKSRIQVEKNKITNYIPSAYTQIIRTELPNKSGCLLKIHKNHETGIVTVVKNS